MPIDPVTTDGRGDDLVAGRGHVVAARGGGVAHRHDHRLARLAQALRPRGRCDPRRRPSRPGCSPAAPPRRPRGRRRTAASASRIGSAQATAPCTGEGSRWGRPSVMAPSTRITATRLGPPAAGLAPAEVGVADARCCGPAWRSTNFSIWRSSPTSSTSARSLASAGGEQRLVEQRRQATPPQPARLARARGDASPAAAVEVVEHARCGSRAPAATARAARTAPSPPCIRRCAPARPPPPADPGRP